MASGAETLHHVGSGSRDSHDFCPAHIRLTCLSEWSRSQQRSQLGRPLSDRNTCEYRVDYSKSAHGPPQSSWKPWRSGRVDYNGTKV